MIAQLQKTAPYNLTKLGQLRVKVGDYRIMPYFSEKYLEQAASLSKQGLIGKVGNLLVLRFDEYNLSNFLRISAVSPLSFESWIYKKLFYYLDNGYFYSFAEAASLLKHENTFRKSEHLEDLINAEAQNPIFKQYPYLFDLRKLQLQDDFI